MDYSTLPLGTHFSPLDDSTTTYISLHPFDDQNPPRHCPTPYCAKDWGDLGSLKYPLAPLATLAHCHRAAFIHHPALPDPPTESQVIASASDTNPEALYSLPACLRHWQRHSLWLSTIVDYAIFLPSEITCLHHAIATYGGVSLGLRLPFAWQTDTLWDVGCGYDYRPNTWGYFAAPAIAYTPAHVEIIAWGQVRTLTHDAVARYAAEAYVPLGIH